MGESVNTDGRVDVEQARSALQQVQTQEDRALRAACQGLPWWNPASRVLIFTVIGASAAVPPDYLVYSFPAVMIGVTTLTIGLQELTERRIGIKIRPEHNTARSFALGMVDALGTLAVLGLTMWGFNAIGAPLPYALAGLVTGLVAAALAQPVHRARYGALRRRQS